jgi:hypothetical protein
MDQQISRLDANTDDSSQPPNHFAPIQAVRGITIEP